MADELRVVGVETAAKQTAFVRSFQPTEMADAEALSQIMGDAVTMAANPPSAKRTNMEIAQNRIRRKSISVVLLAPSRSGYGPANDIDKQ